MAHDNPEAEYDRAARLSKSDTAEYPDCESPTSGRSPRAERSRLKSRLRGSVQKEPPPAERLEDFAGSRKYIGRATLVSYVRSSPRIAPPSCRCRSGRRRRTPCQAA